MSDNTVAPTNDVDLYCLHCGYNLRGLSGDPRRCPECGHFNPMGDVALPAPLISAQLREMETAPAMCLLCALVGVASVWGMIWDGFVTPSNQSIGAPFTILCATALIVCAILWLFFCLSFRSSCLHKFGWSNALWRYHLFGALTVAVSLGPLFAIIAFAARRGNLLAGLLTYVGMIKAIAGAVLFIGFVWGELVAISWFYVQAKSEMEPLQREVAVTVARNVLRKRLFKKKR